jgi:hypothetical protein
MPLSLTFRLLVVLSVILGFSSAGVDLFFTDLIPPDISAALEKTSTLGLLESHPFISLAVLLPWLVAAFAGVIGLFLFKRWGRALSLYSTALGFFLFPFFGPVVSSGVSYALDEAAITLWGAALAVAFFSPISERFRVENR